MQMPMNLTYYLLLLFNDFIDRKCASPRKQNLKAITKTLCAGASSSDFELVPFREYHEVTGDIICPSMVQGIDHLRDPRLNKVNLYIQLCAFGIRCYNYDFFLSLQGLGFTLEERQALGIHGLQPARFKSQVKNFKKKLDIFSIF